MAAKLPTHCITCSTSLTSKNRASSIGTLPDTFDDMCLTCYESGTEATDAMMNDGHVTPELVPVATGRKNIDHSSHNHPATPKARAACRAMGGFGITHPIEEVVVPVVLNARVSASAKTVHRLGTETNEGLPLCGAKFNTDKAATTPDAVTCKNCLKVA